MTTKNQGTLIGRLSQDVKFADNKLEDGTRPVDYIQSEGFIPATKSGNGVYDHMKKGDLVSIAFSVRPNSYEKDGEKVYVQKLIVEGVDLLHTKREAKA